MRGWPVTVARRPLPTLVPDCLSVATLSLITTLDHWALTPFYFLPCCHAPLNLLPLRQQETRKLSTDPGTALVMRGGMGRARGA